MTIIQTTTTMIRALQLSALCLLLANPRAQADDLIGSFRNPPDSARPGVYWYFMDGNLSRDGMTRDLEAMKTAGMGHLVFLEVNVGVPRGPVDFLSEEWQDLYVHAVREAERLGIEITLGSGPGWTGSGGPWVKPEQSMQHLVAAKVEVQGPGKFEGTLPVAPPHRPFFGAVPEQMRPQWEKFYQDVAVLAFPTPAAAASIPDIDEKALVYRAPYSSQPNVKSRLAAPATYPADPPDSVIPLDRVIDLTSQLKPDGKLDWQIPAGKWTVMRFVSRNNGASTRPAPAPGIGFECDKFDADALDAHFEQYVGKLLKKTEPHQPGRGWTMLHIDSWEMGAQNWSPKLREEFRKRRGYDPQPFYPAYSGQVVGSRELTERFLWDLRLTGQDLVLDNHARRLKELGRRHGFGLSIEPYDMNPTCDFDLGAVADVPMCEFWSVGFETAFSCITASSIAHVMGRPVVAAEAFTGAPGENWKLHPGALKNQGDWAFCTGVNRFTYHTFAHKPDEGRPGMVMGPYGVHWDRGQTWWPMVGDYHRYITRCQHLLRQGRTVADVLYLIPEGAPNVFTPPASAFTGDARTPDRRGYNFDGCSAPILIEHAQVRDGCVVFPGGASYRLLVLPDSPTMTPILLDKLDSLVKAGATIVGNPPRKSPSLVDHPACDAKVAALAGAIWGTPQTPAGQSARHHGAGTVVAGEALYETAQLYPNYDLTDGLLGKAKVPEDFTSSGPLRFTHRSTAEREIYFVANRSASSVRTTATFRVANGDPELWNPLDGGVRPLPEFSRKDGLTEIPLEFDAFGSCFIVFPNTPDAAIPPAARGKQNFPELKELPLPAGAWNVSFDPSMGAPAEVRFDKLEDWTQRPEAGLKYYSGIATYRTSFDLPESMNRKSQIQLDLGEVQVMARVRVNGTDCGIVWTAPRRVDISRAVKPVGNLIEIEVANLWPNRMIGDAGSPDRKFTQTTYRPYKPKDPLLPSGLIGPVRLMETPEP